MRDAFNPPGLEQPLGAYSQVSTGGDLVYISGQVGRDVNHDFVSKDVAEQVRFALENVRTALASAGCTLDDVLKVSSFLGDNSYFQTYDRVYKEFFSEPYPARTTVAIDFGPDDDAVLEIDVVARRTITPSHDTE